MSTSRRSWPSATRRSSRCRSSGEEGRRARCASGSRGSSRARRGRRLRRRRRRRASGGRTRGGGARGRRARGGRAGGRRRRCRRRHTPPPPPPPPPPPRRRRRRRSRKPRRAAARVVVIIGGSAGGVQRARGRGARCCSTRARLSCLLRARHASGTIDAAAFVDLGARSRCPTDLERAPRAPEFASTLDRGDGRARCARPFRSCASA